MVKGKKITKKRLKEPDEFISVTERAFLFAKDHIKKIAAVGIILLVVILAVFFFQLWEKKKEAEASQKFGLAMEVYQRVSSPSREGSASTEEYKNVLERFDEIMTRYPRSSAGKLSLLYKGNIQLGMGQYEEAIKTYSTFLDEGGKEKLYRYFAMEGLGHAYEGKKDYEKAVQAYRKIIDMGDGFPVADAYLNMGTCYEKLGKGKEALDSYKEFLKSAPKSTLTNAILRKVSILEK